MLIALLLAQTTTPPPSTPEGLPIWLWPVLTAIGTFLVTLMSGKIIVPTFAYLRERDRADRQEAMREAYADKVDEQVRPALENSRQAIKESAAAARESLAYTKELQVRNVELEKRLAVMEARKQDP